MIIENSQGAVKLSEVASDEALSRLNTSVSEDGLTILKQLYQMTLDANTAFHAFSDGRIKWTGTEIKFDSDARSNNLVFRFLKTSGSARTVDLVMQGGSPNATHFNNIALNDGELIYVEIKRSELENGTVVLENAVNGGSIISGKTVKKIALSAISGMPAISVGLNGESDTLNLPIAFRYDWMRGSTQNRDIMWACNGERWKADSTIEMGSSVALSQGGAILNFLEVSDKAWDAEVDTSGWQLYNDSTALPDEGNGGTVNPALTLAITANTAEVLSGQGSFALDKTGFANILGHGASVDFTVYKGYRRKRLIARMLFEFISGFDPDLIGVYIVADPNGAKTLITPYYNLMTGSKGEITAAFDPIESVEQYRLCIHIRSSNANPFRLVFDDVKINQVYFVAGDAIGSPAMAGFIQPTAQTTDSEGWFVCDGRELPQSSYQELYNAIGTRFGSRTTGYFNIPDLRGQFLRGAAPAINTSFLPSAVSVAANTITVLNSGINRSGIKIRFSSTNTLPAGLSAGTDYWSIYIDSSIFLVASSLANALAGVALDITSQGLGTHTVYQFVDAGGRVQGAVGAQASGVGSVEADATQGHWHYLQRTGGYLSLDSNVGAVGAGWQAPAPGSVTGQTRASTMISDGVNGDPRITSETRPTNVAVNYVIKLYNDKKNIILSNSRVEYSSNQNAIDVSDFISFNQANFGSLIPQIPLASTGIRRVEFSRPINISDRFFMETDLGSGGAQWTDASQIFPYAKGVSGNSGLTLQVVPSKPYQMDVYFGNYGAHADGTPWSSYQTWRWRIVLTSNPNSVETSAQDEIGIIKMFGGDSAPAGYLICDGKQVLKSAYLPLFSVIGNKFGAGDGSGNFFNLPDFRGIFPRGAIKQNAGYLVGGIITAVDTVNDKVTIANHNFNRTGFPIKVSGGSLPAGLGAGDYYAIVYDQHTIAFATSISNALADIKVNLTSGTTGGIVDQNVDPSTRYAANVGGASNGGVGSVQEDAFQSHWHEMWSSTSQAFGVGNPHVGNTGATNPNSSARWPISDGTNGQPRTASDTRPKNINVNFVIKY